MYNQSAVSIKSSASLLYNNLDVLSSASGLQYAVVHKSNVWVFDAEEIQTNQAAYRRVVCKGEGTQTSSTIMQAKWCVLPQRTLLVVGSVKGAQMFDENGSMMIFWQALQPHPKEGKPQFVRGITAAGDNRICIGTADGSIYAFDIPTKGNGVKLHDTINAHTCALTDLHALDDCMVSADDMGKIILWKVGGAVTKTLEIEGFGFPCTSVRLHENFIIAAYGSGHLRKFNRKTGTIIVEVAAHAKWINAMDLSQDGTLVVTASEDTFLRLFDVETFELKFQKAITDVQLTGVRFMDAIDNSFGVTGYDSSEITIFKPAK